jgi:HlyD family secretion protein
MPLIAAPTHTYDNDVSGAGIVEPASEVIALAIERGGVRHSRRRCGRRPSQGRPALFSIDARNYQAAVAQDEAAVAAESAAIASVEQSIILQRDAIDQAGANLDSAEAERTRASLDHARYAVLVRSASATRQRFESATADAEKASASVAAMKATSPARGSRTTSFQPSAARRRQSSTRRKLHARGRGLISTRPWSRRPSMGRFSRSMPGSASMRKRACCPIR